MVNTRGYSPVRFCPMSWDGAHYETRSVKAFKGAEARTIARWEGDGWELIAQPPGGWTRELYFRRVKHPSGGSHARTGLVRRPLVIGGAVAAVAVLAVVIGTGGDDQTPAAAAADASAPSAPEASETTSTDEVLSPYRDNATATLVTAPDGCSAQVSDFAGSYAGRTIEIDSHVVATKAVGGDRYDVLVRAGDYTKKRGAGADFALQGITVDDLHLSPTSGQDYVAAGDNITMTATVGAYDADRCMLFVTPVATDVR